jgi:acetoin utilization deacetylase AcuC-like enzyme
MRVSFSPGYSAPLPANHPFPMSKFVALHQILLNEEIISSQQVIEPQEAEWEDLLRVHTYEYLNSLKNGTLDAAEERRLGLPWSKGLVRRSRLAAQGTMNAARMALEDGIAANLAGGTHHAFPDHGEGFCVLNDIGIAIRRLAQDKLIRRALVIDLDVHQGNGTAAVFSNDPTGFTFSMHGARNYPFYKTPSSHDVDLADQTNDETYLSTLATHLPFVLRESQPDIVFYLAGVDPMIGDRFGRLALTREGLHKRDRYVLKTLHRHALPVVLALSGGYAKTPEMTADLHAITHREARQIYG